MEDSGLFTWLFWKQTIERMVRAFAGGLVGTTLINTTGVGLDWKAKLLGAAGVSLTSLIISLAGSFTGDKTSPSLVKTSE